MSKEMEQQLTNEWNKYVNYALADIIETLEKGMHSPEMRNLAKNAILLGDKAPDFTLTNQLGNSVNLYKLLEAGPGSN